MYITRDDIGRNIWSNFYGKGTITGFIKNGIYPVEVTFLCNVRKCYTLHGMSDIIDYHSVLTWDNPRFTSRLNRN